MRNANTNDLYPNPSGTVVTTALSARGGTQYVTIAGTAANVTYDTSKKLTANARGSIKVETASGITTQGVLVAGNFDAPSLGFDVVVQFGTNPTTNWDALIVYNTAGTGAFRIGRTGTSGQIRMTDFAGSAISSPAVPAFAFDGTGTISYRIRGRVQKGTTTTDGFVAVQITRVSDGVTVFTWTSSALNTGTANLRQVQVGKLTSTGATGTGLTMWIQDFVAEDVSTGFPTSIEIVTAGNFDLIIGTGASNLVGRATNEGAIDTYPAGVYVLPQHGANQDRIVAATEYLRHPDPTEGLSPINTFVADYVAGKLGGGRRVLIVPVAYGGTGFTIPDSNGASMTWRADAPNDANSRFWYMVAVTNAALAAAGSGSNIVAMLHNAGSTDGSNNTPKETYRGYFTAFIDAVRTQLGSAFPILLMQSRPDLMAAETRHRILDEVLRETVPVKAKLGYAYSPVGSTYYMGDAVHFNAAGVRDIGHRLYAQYDAAMANTGSAKQGWLAVYAGSVPATKVYVGSTQVWP